MIGLLKGIIIEKQPPHILLDVNGVGYDVEVSMNTYYQLPETGKTTTLHTHFVVREDAQLLYGFANLPERQLFRSLIKVNGVGPKLAITILSSITPDDFVRCIADNDSASLTRLPGIGKKTAERLIVEMRDKFADWQPMLTPTTSTTVNHVQRVSQANQTQQEAISALVALGYKPQEASRLINQIYNDNMRVEELIRLALKGVTA